MSNLLDTLDTFLSSLHSSLPPLLQSYLTRPALQTLLRSIIILSTYLLFRPHLESLFRKITKTPDKTQEEIKARLEFLQQQKDGITGNPKPNPNPNNLSLGPNTFGGKIPLVNREGKIVKLLTPEEAEAMKKSQQQQKHKGTKGSTPKSTEVGRSGGKKGRKKA
ncbi:hypothetical protein LTR67_000190 [Exophiala xenobiotica]